MKMGKAWTSLAVVSTLLCAGCSPASEQAPANQSEPAPSEQPAVEVPPLAGQWTVTQINGARPGQVWPMLVDVTDERFIISSECRRFIWSVSQDRNLVQFSRQGGRDCPRPRSPSEETVERPVDMANIAMFSDEGREVLLTGPGGSLAMRRR
ncbi:MAG TPA: hypothetical protein VM346_03640 [Sphingomicrobium sp.]|jgi:hypothetical protein|nr:hypothetical protein [Sphingomicrobium sp.]